MALSRAAILDAAQLLFDTRMAGERIDHLPDHLVPTTIDDGYAIQRAGHELATAVLGPWKVGATTVAAQRILGIDGPFVGRPDGDRIVASGTPLPLDDWFVGAPAIETEIGLLPRVDLSEIPDDPMDFAEMVDVVPCLELVNSRFTDMTVVGTPSLIADNAVASAIVAGEPMGWSTEQIRALDSLPVSIDINGTEAAAGTGAMALGHPLNVMHYVATFALASGSRIAAGDLVITGTCTGIVEGAAGMNIAGSFDGTSVDLSFT